MTQQFNPKIRILTDTHVHQETWQECLATGNSKNLETTLVSIKEDKYTNQDFMAFADDGKLCISENVLSWIKKHVTEECIQSDTILIN